MFFELALTTCLSTAFIVDGTSMLPLLHHGDTVSAVSLNCRTLNAGGIVIFRPTSGSALLVKKLIALPDDIIHIRHNRILINGFPANAPDGSHYILNQLGTKLLKLYEGRPLGGHLVIGRSGSKDSSEFGPISINSIIGVVSSIQTRDASPKLAVSDIDLSISDKSSHPSGNTSY